MLFARFALTYHPSFAPITHFEGGGIPGARWDGDTYNNKGVSTEWLRAEKLCTLSGKFHLRWEVPMADVSYYVPSAAIHSFFMFMPFFVIKPQNMIQGFVLWATGPALANYISPDLTEQASIWCFFSISQIVRFFFPASLTMIASTTPPHAPRRLELRYRRFVLSLSSLRTHTLRGLCCTIQNIHFQLHLPHHASL